MTALDKCLDQIAASAKTIADLEFPPPRIFTNALLGQHEITTLIRDTEPHERSLFTLNPDAVSESVSLPSRKSNVLGTDGNNRRKTVSQLQQRNGSAVAKVLGNDMLREIQRSSRGHGRTRDVNVEILLQGAEKLCVVYPVADARDRISKLRSRYSELTNSVTYYEGLVLKQQNKVNRMNRDRVGEDFLDDEAPVPSREVTSNLTDDYFRIEEEEVKALEVRKKKLEDRVAGIEKDLGGLLR